MSLALVGCGGGSTSTVDSGKDATAVTPDGHAADATRPADGVGVPEPEAGQPEVSVVRWDARVDVTVITPIDAAVDFASPDVAAFVPDGRADLASLPDMAPVKDVGFSPADATPDAGTTKSDSSADVHNSPDVAMASGDLGQGLTVDAADGGNDVPSGVTVVDANGSEARVDFDSSVEDLGVVDVMDVVGPS